MPCQITRERKASFWDDAYARGGIGATTQYSMYFIKPEDTCDKKTLELGCGTLEYARHVESSRCYVGVDISEIALRKSKEIYKQGKFILADAASLPLKENSFDSVLAVLTLSITGNDAQSVLKESARVLRPGGSFVFDVVHSDWGINSWNDTYEKSANGLLFKCSSFDIMTYTESGIKRAVEDAGLSAQSTEVLTNYAFKCLGTSGYQRPSPYYPNADTNHIMKIRALKR